jgi:hypothetical protein
MLNVATSIVDCILNTVFIKFFKKSKANKSNQPHAAILSNNDYWINTH